MKLFLTNSKFDRFVSTVMEATHKLDRWEKIKARNPMISAASALCAEIEEKISGASALMVGGTVRDLLMGNHNVHDVDIATNAPLDKIEQMYPTHDIGKSKDFGIVTVSYDGFSFEVANFRTEEG
jgi:tRNA nucleotidyltransferase/poly(A) polymerase